MAYIYQADVWCDTCGDHIKAELDKENKTPEDPEDESSFDSDEYPKRYDAENEESDGPENCADGKCGGFANGHAYGMFLENQLTQEGYRYLKGMLDSHGATLPEFAKEWAEFYQFEYHKQEWGSAHEWLESKSGDEYLLAVIDKLDGDTIQDVFEKEMEEDGFFKTSGWYSPEMEN
jgi:hypothetical protein